MDGVQSCIPTSNADGSVVFPCACDQIRMRQQCSLPGCLGSCLLCCIPAPASPCIAPAMHILDCGSDTSTDMVSNLDIPCVHAVEEVLLCCNLTLMKPASVLWSWGCVVISDAHWCSRRSR